MQEVIDLLETTLTAATATGEVLAAAVGGVQVRRDDTRWNERRSFPLILIIGEYGRAHADFAWNRLLIDELELIGSNASADAWPEAVRLVVEDGLPLDKLISCRLPAEQFQRGVDVTRADRDTIKVVLQW